MHGLQIGYECLERRPFGNDSEGTVPFSRVIGDNGDGDVRVERSDGCHRSRHLRHRTGRIDDDHVDAAPRDRLEERRGATQDLDLEATPCEQEARHAVEPRVPRRHEHSEGS